MNKTVKFHSDAGTITFMNGMLSEVIVQIPVSTVIGSSNKWDTFTYYVEEVNKLYETAKQYRTDQVNPGY